MFSDLRPYRERGENGLPAGWRANRLAALGRVFKANGGSKEDDAATGVPCVRYGDLYTRFGPMITRVKRTVDADRASSYTAVERGDVLFAASGETEADIGRSAVVLVDDDVVAGGDIIVFRRRVDIDPAYLGLALDSVSLRSEKAKRATGTMIVHISPGAVKTLLVPVPPHDEQVGIVKYLAHAHRRIDRAIAAKRELIELLAEQKQAVTRSLITRGLDADAPLKCSGVSWLGRIPEAWQTVPLKFLSRRVVTGVTPPTSEEAYYGGSVPWYGPSSLGKNETLNEPVRYIADQALAEGVARLVEPPALAVVAIGATAGKSALFPDTGATNQQLTSFEIQPARVDERFLLHQMRLAEQEIRASASTATIPLIDLRALKRLPVALPPLEEQRSIVDYIASENAVVDAAIGRASREIGLLNEFRTRLTSDVVTGQLDVRKIAARLPGIDPSEAIGEASEEPEGNLADEAAEYLEAVEV